MFAPEPSEGLGGGGEGGAEGKGRRNAWSPHELNVMSHTPHPPPVPWCS